MSTRSVTISVAPAAIAVIEEVSEQFTAACTSGDVTAEQQSACGKLSWSVTPPTLGNIDKDGIFTASSFEGAAAGSANCDATLTTLGLAGAMQGVTASTAGAAVASTAACGIVTVQRNADPLAVAVAGVVVVPHTAVTLRVSPKGAIVYDGGAQNFAASCTLTGTMHSVKCGSLLWSLDPPDLGILTTSVGGAAGFAAPTISNSVELSDVCGAPSDGDDEEVVGHANGTGDSGLPVAQGSRTVVSEGHLDRCGGIAAVRASRMQYPATSDVATVDVFIVTGVRVSPVGTVVSVGGQKQFGASCVSKQVTLGCDPVGWSVNPPHLGGVTPNGFFTGAGVGPGSVVARRTANLSLAGATIVRVVAPPVAQIVSISPSTPVSTDAVTFTGRGLVGSPLSIASMVWASSIDGLLASQATGWPSGTDVPMTRFGLNVGTHSIDLHVKDTSGGVGKASQVLVVSEVPPLTDCCGIPWADCDDNYNVINKFGLSSGQTINGTAKRDLIIGTEYADTIEGEKGSDCIYGLGGDDTINGDKTGLAVGTDIEDEIHGGDGNDHLHGDAGKDVIYGDGGRDRVAGDAGDDILWGGDGSGNNSGADMIIGDAGDDRIYGEDGDDRLCGNSGGDVIDGGTGNDAWRGGGGSDSDSATESVAANNRCTHSALHSW